MLDFVTSLTVCPSDLRKITKLLHTHDIPVSRTLNRILVTPLFVQQDSLNLIKGLKEVNGIFVQFDSGGYYVQTGRLTFTELYYPLLQYFQGNPWADVYTLPDHVPTSQDSPDVVWSKVKDTVRYSQLFYDELPPGLRTRTMPVIQGHTYEQVDYCLRAYLELDTRYLGFGSFGTTGTKGEVNVATSNSVALARYVAEVAKKAGRRVHLFGLGVPALAAMISSIGASSFDSSSWIKAAGFGQVYLPFMRAHNISHRNMGSTLQKGITVQRFLQYRELTGHSCPFCEDVEKLQQKKMYRALHNLLSIQDTVHMINRQEYDAIEQIYRLGSPRYRKEYEKWLAAV